MKANLSQTMRKGKSTKFWLRGDIQPCPHHGYTQEKNHLLRFFDFAAERTHVENSQQTHLWLNIIRFLKSAKAP